MRLVVALFLLATSLCVVQSSANLSTGREYFAEEEKLNDRKLFALIPDDEGHPHIVNLRRPRDVDFQVVPEDITVYFYSKANPSEGLKLEAADFDGSVNDDAFDSTKMTVFVTHGWMGSNVSHSSCTARDAFLQQGDANVFIIDWRRLSHEFYTVARLSVNDLGHIIGGFIDKILGKYSMDAGNVMLIGNSLGAHVMGASAAAMKNKPGFIMGLDPAKPLFYVDEPDDRLDTTDGRLVHIMHTNGGFLGFRSAIGHADYFANGGGMIQPGCGHDLVGYCAHYRAIDYYSESINSRAFRALQCDSYEDYENGLCDGNQVSYYGGLNIDTNAHGDFHLNTNAESPYAQN